MAGTHLKLHALARGRDHLGDVVQMDEYVGKLRVRMLAVVVQAVPGKKIVWQLRKGVRLPVWLTLELADRDGGVDLRHTITAGFRALGRSRPSSTQVRPKSFTSPCTWMPLMAGNGSATSAELAETLQASPAAISAAGTT